VTFFELNWALGRGRVEGPSDIRGWRRDLLTLGLREIALSAEIALKAAELDNLHGDLFDRIIVATALVEDAVLLTADRPLLAWSGKLRRQDARL
jgi:PIN domain nuclease of toxin-antitoxin system